MVKFAHLADCHLGGWRQEELQSLNFKSFQKVVEICILEKVDFVLISGDLFDSAYPPIEVLKETFAEFKKFKDANIPIYLIAGSHDFSASGKTFLDVLEKAGFCKNVGNFEIQEDGKIKIYPSFFGDIAIFGYPGKKSGMEVEDLKKIFFSSLHPFTIFMFHSTVKEVVGNLPVDFIEKQKLPLANYYAMGHIHQVFEKNESGVFYVYPGPSFPNNFQELVDLKCGSFQLVEESCGKIKTKNIKIPLKEVVFLEIELKESLTATQKIISEIDKINLNDKIFLLKLKGVLMQGKTGDIHFNEIEEFIAKKGTFSFLRNISSIKIQETELDISSSSENVENMERKIIGEYSSKNPADFNKFLPQLMDVLSMEKNEEEKSMIFEERLVSELKNILEINSVLT
ncbi:MAG: exonuclease SbcCD subunit D [Candidatus Pacearchaeota archaeon]